MIIEVLPVLMCKGKVSGTKLKSGIIEWYHEYFRHPGEVCTKEIICATMICSKLIEHAHQYCKNYPKCQLAKKSNKKYGNIPVKEDVTVNPW